MARVKIYGKLICTYKGHSNNEKSLLDRQLEIYQLPSGTLKGVLWRTPYKGWGENPNNIISTAKFFEKDKDNTEYRVLEYFGGKSKFCYRHDATTGELVAIDKL